MTVHAVAARISVRVLGARSLKDKRQRIRPVVDRIRHRHHLSVSEVGLQDSLSQAELGIAVVAPTEGRARELLELAERVVFDAADLEVLDVERVWLDPD